MKTVFVVTQGDYSDYHITGIYTKRELAQAAVEHVEKEGGYYSPSIEEWIVDNGPTIPHSYKLYTVGMQRDGSVFHSEEDTFGGGLPDDEERFSYSWFPLDGWSFKVVAKTMQHAIKIVNEKRIQLVANNDWPTRKQYPS